MNIFLPRIHFREKHPAVELGIRLHIWSKPSREDGEFTARVIIGILWYPWCIFLILATPNLLYTLLAVGATDLVLIVLGIRTTVFFIPISVYTFGFALWMWLNH